jgi:hypothetical protein
MKQTLHASAQHISLNHKTGDFTISNDFDQTRRLQALWCDARVWLG